MSVDYVEGGGGVTDGTGGRHGATQEIDKTGNLVWVSSLVTVRTFSRLAVNVSLRIPEYMDLTLHLLSRTRGPSTQEKRDFLPVLVSSRSHLKDFVPQVPSWGNMGVLPPTHNPLEERD